MTLSSFKVTMPIKLNSLQKGVCCSLILAIMGCSSSDEPSENSTYSLNKANKVNTENLSNLDIDNPTYDFGTVIAGEKVKHIFLVTNKSKIPLIIKDANTTCGCTVAAIPKKPILFNQKDSITAVFSSSAIGKQNKVITVFSNATDSVKLLTLIGTVIEKK